MKTLTNRKAQMHITETIAVLFIFFVLVGLGMMFYYKYQQSAFKEEQQKINADKAIENTLRTLYMPELMCSKGEAEFEDNCFDLMKLRSVNETFSNHLTDYYFQMFSYGKIKVVELYPEPHEWVIYDKKRTNETSYEATFSVISLKDATRTGESIPYAFGYVEAGVYYAPME